MHFGRTIEALSRALPAVDGPWEDSIEPDRLFLRLAAVLVVLFPNEDEAAFLLTKRPDTLRSHPGQIALPGGRVEPEDSSPWSAALRETWEEIAIRPESVKPVGRLDPLQVTVSNNLILPFAGYLVHRPLLDPPGPEVDEVFEVPLNALLDPRTVEEDRWRLRDGNEYVVTYYRLSGQVVWGVTARILADLASRLGHPAAAFPPGSVRPVA
jgi:8-oxo-dGTP pyrophosphatase MutT (NUDIX family)